MKNVTKGLGIAGGIIAILASLATITFLILGLCGVFPLDDPNTHYYHIRYYIDESTCVYDEYFYKGEEFKENIEAPSKADDEKGKNYRFIGWDTNGDGVANIIPSRVYYSYDAHPVYLSEPVESKTSTSSSNSEEARL